MYWWTGDVHTDSHLKDFGVVLDLASKDWRLNLDLPLKDLRLDLDLPTKTWDLTCTWSKQFKQLLFRKRLWYLFKKSFLNYRPTKCNFLCLHELPLLLLHSVWSKNSPRHCNVGTHQNDQYYNVSYIPFFILYLEKLSLPSDKCQCTVYLYIH